MARQATKPIRLLTLGETGAARWVDATGDRDIVGSVDSAEVLLRAHVDVAIAAVSAAEAVRIASEAATQENHPPLVLLVGGGDRHPLLRLMATVANAKREWEESFDAIVDAVAVVDGGGTIRRANRSFAELAGRSFDDIVRAPYGAILGPVHEGIQDPIQLALEAGHSLVQDARFMLLPGLYQVTVSPFTIGEHSRAVVILKDVTAAREQQQRLEMTHRLADIGRLAGGVAHEISTPLASIALRAESLLRKAQDERLVAVEPFKDFPRYLKTIEDETFRCKRIIGALLEFSRSRSPEMAQVDLNGLVERAVALVGDQARARQVQLAFRPDPELGHVLLDATQIREALIALLLNAIDATAASGTVEVATRRISDSVASFSVRDNGAGIPPENLDRIFTPFFTTKPVGQGTGLGLAICDGIVRAHDGSIRVDSRPGRGSCFTVEIPTRRASGRAAEPKRLIGIGP